MFFVYIEYMTIFYAEVGRIHFSQKGKQWAEGGKCPNNDKWLIDIDELLFLLTTWSGWFMPVENWIALTGIHTQFWWDVSIYTQVNSPLPFGVFLANSFQQVDLWSCQMNDSGWDSNSSPMISTLDPGPNSLPSPQGVQSACCCMDIHWWMGGRGPACLAV